MLLQIMIILHELFFFNAPIKFPCQHPSPSLDGLTHFLEGGV